MREVVRTTEARARTPGTLPSVLPSGRSQEIARHEDGAPRGVDGALTLQLVEHAVQSIHGLEDRAEFLSSRAMDLIALTRGERERMQAELAKARDENAAWRAQAMEAEARLQEATLRTWEADLRRREAELGMQQACQRADDAERRARDLEYYLKRIGTFLQSKLQFEHRPKALEHKTLGK